MGPDIVEARLATCAMCPHYDDGICKDVVDPVTSETLRGCGCIVSVKAKLATESCPQGLW